MLFRIRGLPTAENAGRAFIEKMGWINLVNDAPREFVIGYVEGCGAVVDSSNFMKMKGRRKVVFAFNFRRVATDVVEVVTETRVWCKNQAETLKFMLYWSLIRPFSGMVRTEILSIIKKQAESEWARSDPERAGFTPDMVVKLPKIPLLIFRAFFRVTANIFPAVAVRVVGNMMMHPPRRRLGSSAERFISTGRRRNFSLGNEQLVGYEFGAGPRVLLIHGLGGSSADFRSIVPMLVESGFQVVALDWKNHGLSPSGAILSSDSFARLAQLMEEMEDIHGVVGHSAGAYIALMACKLLRGSRGPRVGIFISTPLSIGVPIRAFMHYFNLPSGLYCAVLEWFAHHLNIPMDKLSISGYGSDPWNMHTLDTLLFAHDPHDRYAPYIPIQQLVKQVGWDKLDRPGVGHVGILSDPLTLTNIRLSLFEEPT